MINEGGECTNKILITGIHGFIAKNLYHCLCRDASAPSVYGTTREESAYICDILDKIQPTLIYHCGAELYDDDKMFESNVVLTHTILKWCAARRRFAPPPHIVLIGSSSEYGRKREPMAETDALEPDTIYEGTKAACTMLARAYSSTYGIPILVIRPFTIYGLGEKPRKFIQILLDKMARGDRTIEISNGCHDYVYIDDFIDILCSLVENLRSVVNSKNHNKFDIINIGSGLQTSNEELVDAFERVFDYKFVNRLRAQSKTYDSDCWVCNTHKLREILPTWRARSLEDGLIEMRKKLHL